MCFGGGGGSDNSALQYQKQQDAQARQDEIDRQARIASGRQQIDALFDRGETITSPATTKTRPAQMSELTPGQQQTWMATYRQRGGGDMSDVFATTVPDQPATYGKTQPAFDDAFYNQKRQAYIDNYTPQLADQFSKARNDMSFALARAGLTRSSAAADQFARLNAADAVQSATIANQAEGQVSDLRSRVEDQRSNLVTQLQASADPGGTANLALARTQSMAAEPLTFSPLGEVFSGVASGIGNFVQGARQASILQRYGIPSVASATGGSGVASGQGVSVVR